MSEIDNNEINFRKNRIKSWKKMYTDEASVKRSFVGSTGSYVDDENHLLPQFIKNSSAKISPIFPLTLFATRSAEKSSHLKKSLISLARPL